MEELEFAKGKPRNCPGGGGKARKATAKEEDEEGKTTDGTLKLGPLTTATLDDVVQADVGAGERLGLARAGQGGGRTTVAVAGRTRVVQIHGRRTVRS